MFRHRQRKLSLEKDQFFRALSLKTQGQVGVSETGNFREDRKNENGQLPKVKLEN